MLNFNLQPGRVASCLVTPRIFESWQAADLIKYYYFLNHIIWTGYISIKKR